MFATYSLRIKSHHPSGLGAKCLQTMLQCKEGLRCGGWAGAVGWRHKHITRAGKKKSCEKRQLARDAFGAGGAVSLLMGSDYSWLWSTQPAASKTLSMAP